MVSLNTQIQLSLIINFFLDFIVVFDTKKY